MSTDLQPSPTETLLGSGTCIVAFKPTKAVPEPKSETVLILQLEIESFPKLLAAQDDEAKAIELYCGKPDGWAKTLTPSSHELVIAEGERINSDFFGRWVQRRLQRQERLIPGITGRAIAAAAKA